MTEDGPALRSTLDLINSKQNQSTIWHQHISLEGNEFVLKNDPGNENLSHAEDTIIYFAYAILDLGQWDKAKILRRWPECNKVPKTISYQEVLEINFYHSSHISGIVQNIEMQNDVYWKNEIVKNKNE